MTDYAVAFSPALSKRKFWLLWCACAFAQVAFGWSTPYEAADQCLKVGWVLLILDVSEQTWRRL
jgi:hypothetical protein